MKRFDFGVNIFECSLDGCGVFLQQSLHRSDLFGEMLDGRIRRLLFEIRRDFVQFAHQRIDDVD